MNNKAGILPNSFTLPGIVPKELSGVEKTDEQAQQPVRKFKFGQVDQAALMSRLVSTPFNKATTNQRYVLDMGTTSLQKPRIKKLEDPSAQAEPVVSQQKNTKSLLNFFPTVAIFISSIVCSRIVNTMHLSRYRCATGSTWTDRRRFVKTLRT